MYSVGEKYVSVGEKSASAGEKFNTVEGFVLFGHSTLQTAFAYVRRFPRQTRLRQMAEDSGSGDGPSEPVLHRAPRPWMPWEGRPEQSKPKTNPREEVGRVS